MPPIPTHLKMPEPFLVVREHDVSILPSICGLCVGYEQNSWRKNALADHIIEWLPEFSLTPEEWKAMQHANSVKFIRRAAQLVYQTQKFQKRGEFGELFLHAVIRQVHKSVPAISKIYYKSAINDTVKGFDAVHVVNSKADLELWLGEAKFYEKISVAIRDVIAEIEGHLVHDYLRQEFMLITGKLGTGPELTQIRKLLSPNTSLDEVFKRVCIPVLLTYDSPCIAVHDNCSAAYVTAFKAEIQKHYLEFADALKQKKMPAEVRVHLFLIPLHRKKDLVLALEGKLKTWQKL
jgi:hypothetical protein